MASCGDLVTAVSCKGFKLPEPLPVRVRHHRAVQVKEGLAGLAPGAGAEVAPHGDICLSGNRPQGAPRV